MDVAASEFYKEGKYDLDFKNANSDPSQVSIYMIASQSPPLTFSLKYKTGAELAEIYASFVSNYPVVSIEDPFDQDDWESYTTLTENLGKVCPV